MSDKEKSTDELVADFKGKFSPTPVRHCPVCHLSPNYLTAVNTLLNEGHGGKLVSDWLCSRGLAIKANAVANHKRIHTTKDNPKEEIK